MKSIYLKNGLIIILVLTLIIILMVNRDKSDNIETCKTNGFKGVVIGSSNNFIACSDGEIKNGKYVTTKGIIPLETIIDTRNADIKYKNYYLEFK